ncbi:hypothetical protein KR009_010205, partial [Drosophila setifemur]
KKENIKMEMQGNDIDCIRLDTVLPICHKNLTTSQATYRDHTKEINRPCPALQKQTDPSLITGHYANNLKVNGLELKTRTWPGSMDWREEYSQFVKRNKWCNEEIYKLFFVCPPVQYDRIESYLLDLKNTTYMSDYSPNNYQSLISQRNPEYNKEPQIDTDYQTTYGNYYNRMLKMDPYRAIKEPKPKDMTKEAFKKNMRKLFTKYNLTTYYDTICLPALSTAKDGIMPSGPSDRYSLRRL